MSDDGVFGVARMLSFVIEGIWCDVLVYALMYCLISLLVLCSNQFPVLLSDANCDCLMSVIVTTY